MKSWMLIRLRWRYRQYWQRTAQLLLPAAREVGMEVGAEVQHFLQAPGAAQARAAAQLPPRWRQ